ncbi:hypothetical protein D3C86_1983010 [compost metagenome]
MTRPKQDFVARRPNGLETRARPCLAMNLVDRTQEQRLVSCPLVGAEEIVREDFRAAGMKGRMIVGHDENALGHAALRRRSPTRMS